MGWRNHPNFSWSNNQNVQQPIQRSNNNPSGFQNNPVQDKVKSVEESLKKFMEQTTNLFHNQSAQIQSQGITIKNIENQFGQLTNSMNFLPQGALPSNTEQNPKKEGKEQCKAILSHKAHELTSLHAQQSDSKETS